MWWYHRRYEPGAYDDDWEDQPGQGWFYQWVLGVILPLALAAWGVHALATGQAEYGRASLTLRGVNASAFGVALLSAGVFVHCHYFWGNVYDQAWFAVLGKIVGACGFIVAMGVVIVRVGFLG